MGNWKEVNVIPLPKTGKHWGLEDYRIIGILYNCFVLISLNFHSAITTLTDVCDKYLLAIEND